MPTSAVVHVEAEAPSTAAHEAQHLKTRSTRALRWVLIAAGVPVTLLVVITISWAIDTSTKGGKVLRNVQLAGQDVGGLAEEDVTQVVEGVAEDLATRDVRIVSGGATYETTAAEIGLMLDERATVEAVIDMGRTETFPLRPVQWLTSFLSPRDAPLQYRVSEPAVRERVITLEGDARTAPVEPAIAFQEDAFAVVPGKPGRGIAIEDVVAALPAAASDDDGTIVVNVSPRTLQPRFDQTDAEAVAAEAGELSDDPLRVDADGQSGAISVERLRTWLVARATDEALVLALDRAKVIADLPAVVTGFADGPKDARFDIQGGRPVVIAGATGTACCGDDSPDLILGALHAGRDAVTLTTTQRAPAFTTDEAEALKIVEEVGQPSEFGPTTEHKCCENRVINIHKIADLMRGAVILPGETFSVNAYVGQRTAAKGFVSGGAIVNGRVDEQIGGGVSQFATTLFNAALFAGLEFGEYQSHSLYIDRYPKGHEATISWEHPDLQIKNPTPYAVLVWPTYTETSLTVHLYSTRHFTEVLIGTPSPSANGRCTRWTTPRTRTTPDGEVLRDSVYARYRPGEGVNC